MVGAGLWTVRHFKPGARHRRASAGPEVQPYQPLHPTAPTFDHALPRQVSLAGGVEMARNRKFLGVFLRLIT